MAELTSSGALWTPDSDLDRHASGLTPFCCLSANLGERAAAAAGEQVGWAWIRPDDTGVTLAARLSRRFIADMEIPGARTPKAERPFYWQGKPGDMRVAERVIPHALGVTSHGFPKAALRKPLAAFAAAGLPAFPQVYDNDRSTLGNKGGPARFLRDCVSMHKDLGFRVVVPILGLHAGADIVRIWLDTCTEMGLPWHIWRAGLYKLKTHKFIADRLAAEKISRAAEIRVQYKDVAAALAASRERTLTEIGPVEPLQTHG